MPLRPLKPAPRSSLPRSGPVPRPVPPPRVVSSSSSSEVDEDSPAEVEISDKTPIAGTIWLKLKDQAMKPDHIEKSWYTNMGPLERKLLRVLIRAQGKQHNLLKLCPQKLVAEMSDDAFSQNLDFLTEEERAFATAKPPSPVGIRTTDDAS